MQINTNRPVWVLASSGWRQEFFARSYELLRTDSTAANVMVYAMDDSEPARFIEAVEELERKVSLLPELPVMIAIIDPMTFAQDRANDAYFVKHPEAAMPGHASPGNFLSAHKLLAREAIRGLDGIRYRPVYQSDAVLPGICGVDELILKPVMGTGSASVQKVRAGDPNPWQESRPDDLLSESFKLQLIKQYPHYRDVVGIVEEYVPPAIHKITADGWVQNGVVGRWCLTDNVYLEDEPEAFDCLNVPSVMLSEAETEACWQKFEEVVRDLADNHGMNNQFVDVELFVFSDERIEVMEINTRITANTQPNFSWVMDNGDVCNATIALQTGQPLIQPVHNGKYSVALYRDMITDIDEDEPLISNADDTVFYYRKSLGVAHVYAVGDTHQQAYEKAQTFYDSLLMDVQSNKATKILRGELQTA